MKPAEVWKIVAGVPAAVWLKIAAQLPFGLLVTTSLFFGTRELLDGNASEALASLAGALFFGVIIWFGWNDPFGTGGKLVFGGILFLIFSLLGTRTEDDLGSFILGGSALISGLFLLLAAWATPKVSE